MSTITIQELQLLKLGRYFGAMTDCGLTLEEISNYCAGGPLPDGSVGDYLRVRKEFQL